MMRDDFCAFILTHGRPDRVHTYQTLRKAGYTGKIYLVIDDEDKTEAEYRKRYGAEVLQFSKSEIAKTFDEGDNFDDRRAIIYARNACWSLAERVGCRYFIQLDDDYNSGFYIRFNSRLEYGNTPRMKKHLDETLTAMLDYYISIPALSIALSQGGDHIGGGDGRAEPKLMRKCMNSFICSTDRPFQFFGRINEDVNTYTNRARRGSLFFTVLQAQVNQLATQSNAGGMTDMYLDSGTYIKSFYSVMYCPSGVKVGQMGDHRSPHYRLHHKINWHRVAPKILRETYRKASAL
jgi:hypothetical protein